MQVHKIVLTVIDFDRLGAAAVCATLENARFPNDCISPSVMSIETRDCGEWSDDHPLNNRQTADAEIARLFGERSSEREVGAPDPRPPSSASDSPSVGTTG